MPELAISRNLIRDNPVPLSTARGRPVRMQRIRIRTALVLAGISASCCCAACRTDAGNLDDITIDLSAMRWISCLANSCRLTLSM